jgi:putative DNA primase/helicase
MTAETIAKAPRERRAGVGSWIALCCPARGAREPSLSMKTADGAKGLVRCHADCDRSRTPGERERAEGRK